MKSKQSLCILFASLALAAGTSANAAVIAEYTFPLTGGTTGTVISPSSATTVALNVTASTFGGAGVSYSTGGPVSTTGSTSGYGNAFLNRANTGTAKSESHYFEFTVTPDVGKKLNLTTLNFFYGDAQIEASPTVLNLGLYTSVDSYVDQVGSTLSWSPADTVALVATDYFKTASGVQYASLDLSGAAFQNLTTATTFRIYGWDNTNVGGQLRIDDVQLNGSVIPEPSAALLGSLGLFGLFRRRRA